MSIQLWEEEGLSSSEVAEIVLKGGPVLVSHWTPTEYNIKAMQKP